jgi:uncharacterized membrane protein
MTQHEAVGTNPEDIPEVGRPAPNSLSDHIDQNIETVVALQRREWEMTSVSQRRVEQIGRFIGRPVYLVALLCFVVVWVAVNVGLSSMGKTSWDPMPFELLDGLLTLIALVTTTIVLIAQNRQTRLEQQHTHLGLQVNLLTEQKVTKLIHLIEELRKDMPMVRNREDPQATAMQERADAGQVISAIEEVGLADDHKSAAPAKPNNPGPRSPPDSTNR